MHKVYLAWVHMFVALLRWSAVKCLEAKHDPALAKRAPRPAAADAAGPSKAAQKPAANSAAGQIAGIMAGVCCNVHAPLLASTLNYKQLSIFTRTSDDTSSQTTAAHCWVQRFTSRTCIGAHTRRLSAWGEFARICRELIIHSDSPLATARQHSLQYAASS